jgi:exonuclease V gamma subunit
MSTLCPPAAAISNARLTELPRAVSYAAFRSMLPDLPAEMLYDPEVLVWRVMKQLPPLLGEPGFEGLKNYLSPANERALDS